jgi:putative serine protease PepD
MGTRGRTRWAAPASAALLVAVSVTAVAACASSGASSSASSGASSGGGGGSTSSGSAASDATTLQQQYETVVAAVLPSVVQIFTSDATGSGVIYDSKGDIVTNAHVVGTSSTVKVVPATGGDSLTARVLGTFPAGDLAVIRVESGAGQLKPARFANSDSVKAGQIVLAMGNPLGLTGSVSEGIVSALGRTVSAAGSSGGAATTITDAIQTTAAINGGNSGGALVNLSSQVIGIPTAAARDPQAGAAPGIGFAIPSDTATSIASQIIDTGKVTNSGRASLGITASTVATAEGQAAGVGVVSVTEGGPAASAGLAAGDVIVEVDGQQTPTTGALNTVLATLKPGQQVQLKYLRSGGNTTSTATVTLGTLTS